MEEVLNHLENLIITRLSNFEASEASEIPQETLDTWEEKLSDALSIDNISYREQIVLAVSLVPHIRPYFFDKIIQEVYPHGGVFPHLGGIRGKNHRGFIPTIETVLFILSGDSLSARFELQQLFTSDYWWVKQQILHYNDTEKGEPSTSSPVTMDQAYVDLLTIGHVSKPLFSSEFPASLIETGLEWEDLVLPSFTKNQIDEIFTWLNHRHTLETTFGLGRMIKPGYRALFHGAPGTGKTLTATLLGKSDQSNIERDVYRVDLSTIVSKYIGETEKNLSNLFDRAENRDWILLFDEADALFGKRTQVQNSHDRFANQEVAYLLQRIEQFDGLIILSSNFKSNIDEAFMRRFQSIIFFPMPKAGERLQLWKNYLPKETLQLDSSVNLMYLAQQYELTGADILNIVQYLCLNAVEKNTFSLNMETIEYAIQREFEKTDRVLR